MLKFLTAATNFISARVNAYIERRSTAIKLHEQSIKNANSDIASAKKLL